MRGGNIWIVHCESVFVWFFVFFGSVSCWLHGSSTGSVVRIADLVALLVLG